MIKIAIIAATAAMISSAAFAQPQKLPDAQLDAMTAGALLNLTIIAGITQVNIGVTNQIATNIGPGATSTQISVTAQSNKLPITIR
jgi:hypothetical protein